MATVPAVPVTAPPPGIDRAGLVIGVAVGIPATVAVGALLNVFRDAVNQTNAALVLMVVVVAVAAIGGRAAGVVTALGAVVSFDFFLTQPYLSLTIDSRDDVETTILLLVAGVVVGTLAAHQRLFKRRAGSAGAEIRRIHRVAEAAASGAEPATVIATAQDELHELLHLQEARFEARPYAAEATYPQLARNGHLDVQRTMIYVVGPRGGGFELPQEGIAIPVLARGHEVGRFVLVPTPGIGTSIEERVVAVAIADQVAGVLAPEGAVKERAR